MKTKKIVSIFAVSLLAVGTMALSSSAYSFTRFDEDLSKSYEFTRNSLTAGYDIGSIFPFDDVLGWTNNHCGYFNSATGVLNRGEAYVKVVALNGQVSSDRETSISADGVIYASCNKIGGQDYATSVVHEGKSDTKGTVTFYVH